ncbi:sensor histidine kinase [Actinocorallia aurea]
MTALWGFITSITVGDTLSYLRLHNLQSELATPIGLAAISVENERLATLPALGTGQTGGAALTERRTATDQAVEIARSAASSADLRESVTGNGTLARVDKAVSYLGRLAAVRAAVDAGTSDVLQAFNEYNSIYDGVMAGSEALIDSAAPAVRHQIMAVTTLMRSGEMLSRQQALVAAADPQTGLTAPARTAFTTSAGAQLYLLDIAIPQLDRGSAAWTSLRESPAFVKLRSLQAKAVKSPSGRPLPFDAAVWQSTVQEISTTSTSELTRMGTDLTARGEDAYRSSLVKLLAASGLGLLAVIASLFMVSRLGRRLTRELTDLTAGAMRLAQQHLPAVLDRLRRGEEVDAAAELTPIATGSTVEIGQVGQAFTSVQHAAVAAAVAEAELRKGISSVFLNLAWRNQTLLHRQLTLLDTMEQQTKDPDALDDLFKLDHLTTRMRRHAESLIILSGTTPGRTWRHPVPLIDVLRASASEVEDYTRVKVTTSTTAALTGAAVTDVIHLVAELIENAATFSPPSTEVRVRGELVGKGFAIEIEDRGIGVDDAHLAQLNAKLADLPEFDLSESNQLGLFVVARLAARHGIKVTLSASTYGGVIAVVILPKDLVAESEDQADAPARRPEPALPQQGRHRTATVTALAAVPATPRQESSAPSPRPAPQGGRPALPRRVPRSEPLTGVEHPDQAARRDRRPDRSPEEAEKLMSSLQNSWRRARDIDTDDTLKDGQ